MDPPQTGPTQVIEPKCTEPYYTKEALPANWPQVYRALLHQTSTTYWEIRPYPVQMNPQTGPTQLIEPKCTEPSYTKEALPANWPQVYRALLYRALLHQTSITYWEMRPHPVQMDPPQTGPTLLIKPKCSEPYYTEETLPD